MWLCKQLEMKWSLVLLITVSVSAVHGEGDCQMYDPPLHTSECCRKAETIIADTFRTNAKSCFEKYPLPPGPPALIQFLPENLPMPPKVPPPLPFPALPFSLPETPSPSPNPLSPTNTLPPPFPRPKPPPTPGGYFLELRKKHECLEECIFTVNNLLDDSKQLIDDAVRAAFTASLDEDLASTVTVAINHCLDSYKNMVDHGAECSSGSDQFVQCVSKKVLINCPAALATGATCEEAKKQLEKCPNATVFLLAPPKGRPPLPPPLPLLATGPVPLLVPPEA